MSSRSFGARRPQRPSLTVGKRGLAGEVDDLRRDVEAAFTELEEEIDAGGASSNLEPVSFSSILPFSGAKRMEFSGNGTEPCILAIGADVVPEEGSVVQVYIPAGEAGSIIVAPGFNLDIADRTAFSPSSGYIFVVGFTNGAYWSTGKVAPSREVVVPTIVSAEIDGGDLDRLTVTGSEALFLPNLTGLSLTGTVRTISSVASGNGTTAPVLALSGDVNEGDTVSLVLASSRTIQDLNGNKVAAGAHSVNIGSAFVSIPGAIHAWRGDSMTTTGSEVDTIVDQIGSADMVASATNPTTTTLGTNSVPGWKIVASSDFTVDLGTPRAMGTGSVAVTINAVGAAVADNCFFSMGVDGSESSLHFLFWRNTGQANKIGAYTNGSNQVYQPSATDLTTGTHTLIITWDGTDTRIYVDGVASGGALSAGPPGTIRRFRIGRNVNGGQVAVDVKFHDVQVSTTKLNSTQAAAYHTWAQGEVGL
jgi:hypothetical protein